MRDFTTTEQKPELQCGADCESVWDGIIQFRPSGITVKRPNVFSGIGCTGANTRYRESRKKVDSTRSRKTTKPDSVICNKNDHQAYKQLGNAVNVKVIEYMATQLFGLEP